MTKKEKDHTVAMTTTETKPRPGRKPKYKAVVEQDRCVACGVCMNVCPREAITIYQGCYSQVDLEKCIGCGICEQNCPAGVIHKVINS